MSNPLRSLEDYELFLYTLAERFPSIRHSSLTLVRRGATLARVAGEIQFDGGFRVVVLERLLADRRPAVIDAYGYEIWRGQEKLCWYDCQPHPDEPGLQSTHPHHKHVPPDIKRNRQRHRKWTSPAPTFRKSSRKWRRSSRSSRVEPWSRFPGNASGGPRPPASN